MQQLRSCSFNPRTIFPLPVRPARLLARLRPPGHAVRTGRSSGRRSGGPSAARPIDSVERVRRAGFDVGGVSATGGRGGRATPLSRLAGARRTSPSTKGTKGQRKETSRQIFSPPSQGGVSADLPRGLFGEAEGEVGETDHRRRTFQRDKWEETAVGRCLWAESTKNYQRTS